MSNDLNGHCNTVSKVSRQPLKRNSVAFHSYNYFCTASADNQNRSLNVKCPISAIRTHPCGLLVVSYLLHRFSPFYNKSKIIGRIHSRSMEQGLLSSSSKQRAFVQLISSEPSLLNRLDDNFIKSIISLSPAKKRDDMRLDQLTRGYKDGNNRKKSLRLYLENELCGDNQPQLVSAKHLCKAKTVSSMNADTVLLSPSSTATALAAAAQSFQNGWTNQSDVSIKARKTCGNPIHGFQLDMKLQQDHVRRVDVKRKVLRKYDSPRDNNISTGAYESNQHQIGNTCLASMPRSCDSVNYTIDCNESVDAVNSTKSSTFNGTSLTSYTMLDNLRYDSPDSRSIHSIGKTCNVCMREFYVLRKRHTCRICRGPICRRCSIFRQVPKQSMENKLRICYCCYIASRTKDLKNRINQSNGDSENCESSNNL